MSSKGEFSENIMDMKKGMELEKEKRFFSPLKKQEDEINLKYDGIIKSMLSLSQNEGDMQPLIDRFEAKRKKELSNISYGQDKHDDEPKSTADAREDTKEDKKEDKIEKSEFLKKLRSQINSKEDLNKSAADWEKEKQEILSRNSDLEALKKQFDEI